MFTDAHLGAAKRLKDVGAKVPEAIAALDRTERANFLHGQVRNLITAGVEGTPGVAITDWSIFTVAVGADLLVRFKYLGGGRPANVPTNQQKLLAKQQYPQEVFDLLAVAGITDAPTTVTCGYTLDGWDIGRIMIRRDCEGHESWAYDIYGGVAVSEPLNFAGIEEAKPAVVRSRKVQRLDETGTKDV
jgi:hypothetical protein